MEKRRERKRNGEMEKGEKWRNGEKWRKKGLVWQLLSTSLDSISSGMAVNWWTMMKTNWFGKQLVW